MTSQTPTPATPTVKRIVKLGQESFLIVQVPPQYGEDAKVGSIDIEIQPSAGGGGGCCNTLRWG